jgi:hypothetical protein
MLQAAKRRLAGFDNIDLRRAASSRRFRSTMAGWTSPR